ncbi:helix-turn-helix domain-containing protein [Streptomyces boncukensis]|uniref:Helix-turn-helix transcriptional regulator n=1 Tax=Streptomyces boncukensis TaxID=2711219 RepID=A0A6G4X997_9ACTN|nr:helix-turn-helix transcriptional regulator [Streptomyces boncukensis]NGO73430.1 helix-turn-helix transcriptional regulator [Streptomyces boncukensis]
MDESGIGDARRALGTFLRARRGRVAPEQVGIAPGRRRRVRGLRREELAQLAGISVDYYVRLEQGRANQPSPEVLDALAGALGLGPAERRHLATLAEGRRGPAPAPAGVDGVGPALRRIVDGMAPRCPAFVVDHRLDVLAWNAPGAELMGGLGDPARRDRNQARFLFLDPAARDLFPEWENRAREAVGQLRIAAGRFPEDAELAGLLTALSERSAAFRRIWDSGEAVICEGGRKRVQHPVAGALTLDYQVMRVPPALELHAFTAAEDSAEARALAALTSAAA